MIARRCLPLLLVALAGAAGCDQTEPAAAPQPAVVASSAAASFGGTDRAWVEINIAMHEELLPLLDLAPARVKDSGLRALIAELKAAHQQESTVLYELHEAAGLPEENPHKGMPMPGMVTPDDVRAAAATSGATFDKLVRKHLRAHLEQRVVLATSEQKAGVEPRTKALASQIIADRDKYLPRLSESGK